jgi:DNA-binding transcriptional MerR regulator
MTKANEDAEQEELVASLLPPGALPKDGKLYYRIGEVSKITGVKPYVLRYWESEFRWMAPQKSRSKQRLYRRKDIEMILLIRKLLYEERYTIAGARQRLRELGAEKASGAAKAVPRASASAAPTSASQSALEDSESAETPNGAALVADCRRQLREIKNELVSLRASL